MIAKLDSEVGPRLSVRVDPKNPNHHIWDNNGTFFGHFTLHLPNHTKHRRRFSLKTRDIEVARQRRDEFLQNGGLHSVGSEDTPPS